MARLEQGPIERVPVDAFFALGNDHAGPLRAYGVHDPVDVKRLVSKKYPEIRRFEKGRNADRTVMLAGDMQYLQWADGISIRIKH